MMGRGKYDGCDLEALVEVANGSQWTVRASSMDRLVREAQDIIGRDLRGERYYVRYVNVNGRFDTDALNELMAGLRG